MRKTIMALVLFVSACSLPIGIDPGDLGQTVDSLPPVEQPIARCMNLGSSLESPNKEGEWGYYVRRSDIQLLKREGFDTLRLPIRWSTRTSKDAPYQIEPDFLARIDEIAGWALLTDMQIIINVHHYHDLMKDPDGEKDRFFAIWDQIAAHFVDAPDTVIFELINEPRDQMSAEIMSAFNQELLARLRQTHPERWIILTGADWGSLQGLKEIELTYDPRVILSYHDYDPFEFTHQGVHWSRNPPPVGRRWGSREDRQAMREKLDAAAQFQAETRMPLFLGEFGTFRDIPLRQRALWTREMRRGAEARGLSWCYWDFATTLRAFDRSEEAWIEPLRKSLLED